MKNSKHCIQELLTVVPILNQSKFYAESSKCENDATSSRRKDDECIRYKTTITKKIVLANLV